MSKLLVIVGITGVQGGSVARTFLKDPEYRIRGITRDPTKPESKALIAKGIEIMKGDLDDVETLKTSFKGAHTIFRNTIFSNAYHGKNIADAVATVETLELFVWSTLSHASKWSKGKYTGVYHFDSKAVVVEYINERYPKVANKMSLLQMGLFITNWKWGQGAVPWEKNVLAFGDLLPWGDYVKLWSKITGVPAAFEHSTIEDLDNVAPGGYGIEMAEMYAYMQDFGYWGKDDLSVIFARDLGVDIEVTSIEQYIKKEDWSELLSRPVPA